MAPEEPREREVPEWLSAALLYDVAKRGYDGVMSLPVLRRVAPGVQDIAEIFLERCGVPHGHDSALECADGHIETFLEQVDEHVDVGAGAVKSFFKRVLKREAHDASDTTTEVMLREHCRSAPTDHCTRLTRTASRCTPQTGSGSDTSSDEVVTDDVVTMVDDAISSTEGAEGESTVPPPTEEDEEKEAEAPADPFAGPVPTLTPARLPAPAPMATPPSKTPSIFDSLSPSKMLGFASPPEEDPSKRKVLEPIPPPSGGHPPVSPTPTAQSPAPSPASLKKSFSPASPAATVDTAEAS
mmetsp:Transcript_44785/g.140428  ORF Transcript_44785/g.140428 Transcript_44785/m.140428 type:complete len:298 (-) Transcript_44785:270-1163(-)